MPAPHQAQTELFSESRAGRSSQPPCADGLAKPNPVFVRIKPSYLEGLQALGYSESEARFLYVVVTHSGYFVARQFLAFTCGHWGKRATAFWHKLHTKKHGRTEYFPMNGKVYHVFSRKLYGQIGRENLRNRREHEFEYIQRRVGILDFVLSHPQYRYLETEPEKVSYFCQQLKVSTHFLPAKIYCGPKTSQPTVRYFVDSFPSSGSFIWQESIRISQRPKKYSIRLRRSPSGLTHQRSSAATSKFARRGTSASTVL